MNDEPKDDLKNEVLEAIKSGRISMRSKWQIGLHAALVSVGAGIVLLAILYLVSFTVVAHRRSGGWFGPEFGGRGWVEFFASLPWLLVVLSLIFLVILQLIVRRYSFVYSHPMLYSGIGIVLIAIAGGLLLAQTPLHPRLFRYAEEDRLPFGGGLYRSYDHMQFRNTHPGIVLATSSDGFILGSRTGEDLQVVFASGTAIVSLGEFEPGDEVIVFGPRGATSVQAFGVREVRGEEFEMPLIFRRPMMAPAP